jgi:hypothetical protein
MINKVRGKASRRAAAPVVASRRFKDLANESEAACLEGVAKAGAGSLVQKE